MPDADGVVVAVEDGKGEAGTEGDTVPDRVVLGEGVGDGEEPNDGLQEGEGDGVGEGVAVALGGGWPIL